MPMLSRLIMALGALFAALWVGLSAVAAHVPALQQGGSTLAASLQQHQFHALGLVLVGLGLARHANAWLVASGLLMLAGLLLFCLNIDARILWGWDVARVLVPVGGSAFILAWLSLALGMLWPRKRPAVTPVAPTSVPPASPNT